MFCLVVQEGGPLHETKRSGNERNGRTVDSVERDAILGDKVEKLVELPVFYAFSAKR